MMWFLFRYTIHYSQHIDHLQLCIARIITRLVDLFPAATGIGFQHLTGTTFSGEFSLAKQELLNCSTGGLSAQLPLEDHNQWLSHMVTLKAGFLVSKWKQLFGSISAANIFMGSCRSKSAAQNNTPAWIFPVVYASALTLFLLKVLLNKSLAQVSPLILGNQT